MRLNDGGGGHLSRCYGPAVVPVLPAPDDCTRAPGRWPCYPGRSESRREAMQPAAGPSASMTAAARSTPCCGTREPAAAGRRSPCASPSWPAAATCHPAARLDDGPWFPHGRRSSSPASLTASRSWSRARRLPRNGPETCRGTPGSRCRSTPRRSAGRARPRSAPRVPGGSRGVAEVVVSSRMDFWPLLPARPASGSRTSLTAT